MTGQHIPIASAPDDELSHPTHLVPLVQELLARGNELATPTKPHDGFIPTPDGWLCQLVDPVTKEEWAALNEKFDIPPTIHHFGGGIRDDANWVDIIGGGEREFGGLR
jgi:hypothetical protein